MIRFISGVAVGGSGVLVGSGVSVGLGVGDDSVVAVSSACTNAEICSVSATASGPTSVIESVQFTRAIGTLHRQHTTNRESITKGYNYVKEIITFVTAEAVITGSELVRLPVLLP